ncbi:MAG: heme o synthase [Nitrososphaerota archaeon]|nr:heme o synthase [Nitrososphaerota archaeon]
MRGLVLNQSEKRLRGTFSDYLQLMKPGIMVLLVFEALTAMIVAAGRNVQILPLVWLSLAGILASGGSAALNHYLERNRDVLMSRTENRPVATNKIPPKNALVFGVVTIAIGLALAIVAFNLITMLMILCGALSYVFVYTLYLKPRTHWNIVIGGIAGVFPALTGWASVTNSIGWPSIFIGALVFLWTPPHFWGLSMKFKEDYVKSGYPMLPVVKNQKQVINWIVYSSIPLLPFSLLPLAIHAFGSFNFIYYAMAVVMGLAFIWVDIKMLQKPTTDNAFKAFLISLPYLFILFAGMIASAVI